MSIFECGVCGRRSLGKEKKCMACGTVFTADMKKKPETYEANVIIQQCDKCGSTEKLEARYVHRQDRSEQIYLCPLCDLNLYYEECVQKWGYEFCKKHGMVPGANTERQQEKSGASCEEIVGN